MGSEQSTEIKTEEPEEFEKYQFVRETGWFNKKAKDEIIECSVDHSVIVREQQENLKKQWKELRKEQLILKNQRKQFEKQKLALENGKKRKSKRKKKQRQIQNSKIVKFKNLELAILKNQKHAPILNEKREEQKPIVANLAKRKINDEKVVKKEVPVPLKTPKVEPEF